MGLMEMCMMGVGFGAYIVDGVVCYVNGFDGNGFGGEWYVWECE